MWLIIILFAVASARPQQNRDIYDSNGQTTPAAIIAQYDTSSPDGSFNNSYETSNGIKVVNSGHFKRIKVPRYEDINGKVYEEHEEDILVQTGSYSYFDPEGNIITLTYLADENGFQPSGTHLPTTSPTTNFTNRESIHGHPHPNGQEQPIANRESIHGHPHPNGQEQPIDTRFIQSRPIQQQRPGPIQG